MNFCYGAIFNSPTPSEKMEPLAGKQVPFPYDCDDEEGRKNCQQLCITNADAEKSNAGMILCPLLGKTDEPFIVSYKSVSENQKFLYICQILKTHYFLFLFSASCIL